MAGDDEAELNRQRFRDALQELAGMHMPFGRFGPENFPPDGVPLIDLPVEYLTWFSDRGFPDGQLGRMMEIVHRTKLDGADEVFHALRQRRGGYRSLRLADQSPRGANPPRPGDLP